MDTKRLKLANSVPPPKPEHEVKIQVALSAQRLLGMILPEEVIKHYGGTMYKLLDLIGREACMSYFNLVENPDGGKKEIAPLKIADRESDSGC